MATNDESELLFRLRAGDDAAWTVFFDTYSPRDWTYVARLIGADRHAVADVVQEMFIATYQGLARRCCRTYEVDEFTTRHDPRWPDLETCGAIDSSDSPK